MGVVNNIIWRLSIFAIVLLIIRSFVDVALDAIAVVDSRSWPRAQGWVARHADFNPALRYWKRDEIVVYEFYVQGVLFTGNRISFSKRTKWDYQDVKNLTPTGSSFSEVDVYYDPVDPARCVLQAGGSNAANIMFLICQCLVVMLMISLLVFTLLPNRSNSGKAKRTAPSIRNRRASSRHP